MRTSAYSLFIAAALLSECYLLSSAISRAEDSSSELETMDTLLKEGTVESALNPTLSVGYSAQKGTALSREGNSKVIVVADASLWGRSKMLARALPLLVQHHDLGVALSPESILTAERREANQDSGSSTPIGRRETMRCMIGRVYRPCWEK